MILWGGTECERGIRMGKTVVYINVKDEALDACGAAGYEGEGDYEEEFEEAYEEYRPGRKETVIRVAGVAILMYCVLYFAALLIPLEKEVASCGHLQFLDGTVVVKASGIRILHAVLLILACAATELFCKKMDMYYSGFFLLAIMLTLELCMGIDLYFIGNEKHIPLLDRYHQRYEQEWERDPWPLLVEKGFEKPTSYLASDGTLYMYQYNYGIFDNQFAFTLDIETNSEILIPQEGNAEFLRTSLKETVWHAPGTVWCEFYTDLDPNSPLKFYGSYDDERDAWVIPFSDQIRKAQYGYVVVHWFGTAFESRQLFGERPPVVLTDPAFSWLVKPAKYRKTL